RINSYIPRLSVRVTEKPSLTCTPWTGFLSWSVSIPQSVVDAFRSNLVRSSTGGSDSSISCFLEQLQKIPASRSMQLYLNNIDFMKNFFKHGGIAPPCCYCK